MNLLEKCCKIKKIKPLSVIHFTSWLYLKSIITGNEILLEIWGYSHLNMGSQTGDSGKKTAEREVGTRLKRGLNPGLGIWDSILQTVESYEGLGTVALGQLIWKGSCS